MTVSMGRLTPLKDHFVVAWAATMVVEYRLSGSLWTGTAPQRHDGPELWQSRAVTTTRSDASQC